MAASPNLKIYRNGEYVGSTKYAEDAAMFVSAAGGEVRFGHSRVVWREGAEEFEAGESYDRAAHVICQRIDTINRAAYAKLHGHVG